MEIKVVQNIKKYSITANQSSKQINVVIKPNIKKENIITVSQLGKRGFIGLSAYEIAVNNGFTGGQLEWLKSLIPNNVDGGILF